MDLPQRTIVREHIGLFLNVALVVVFFIWVWITAGASQ